VPPLNNARHERFVQLLLHGENATDAHEQAGYVRDDGNATRLRANPKVQERLTELQAEVVKDTKITVESLLGELEAARQRATDLEQLSAAVRAIESKGKDFWLADRKRSKSVLPARSIIANSTEAVVDELLKYEVNPYHDLRDEDRDFLIALFERFYAEADAYIEAITARPFRTSYQAKALPRPHANGNTGIPCRLTGNDRENPE
jgi:phage terminase small subunit